MCYHHHRLFLSAVGAIGLICLIVPAPQTILLAQDAKQATPGPPIDYSQYKSVDDILKGTAFRKVSGIDEYKKEIAQGQVVAFLYDNSTMESSSARLAYVLTQISPSFPDVKFVALERLDSIPKAEYVKLGYEISPDFMVYNSGKLVFRNPSKFEGQKGGGPKQNEEHFWVEGIRRDLNKTFAAK